MPDQTRMVGVRRAQSGEHEGPIFVVFAVVVVQDFNSSYQNDFKKISTAVDMTTTRSMSFGMAITITPNTGK